MNKKDQPKKEFDTVQFFRNVKEKLAHDTKGMTFQEFKKYINQRKLRLEK